MRSTTGRSTVAIFQISSGMSVIRMRNVARTETDKTRNRWVDVEMLPTSIVHSYRIERKLPGKWCFLYPIYHGRMRYF